ncbi:MAG: hypothetical protein M3332_14425, partial [Actinomycetota bacterium]|nr:hypothetical protein [Actinomycetota bacterium]
SRTPHPPAQLAAATSLTWGIPNGLTQSTGPGMLSVTLTTVAHVTGRIYQVEHRGQVADIPMCTLRARPRWSEATDPNPRVVARLRMSRVPWNFGGDPVIIRLR